MKLSTKAAIMSLLISVATPAISAEGANDGLQVEHLGVRNTLVRVTGDDRYLLLPIQESNDDARIDVIVGGRIVKTLYARLAKSKVDFFVPLDLEPWKGEKVMLSVSTSQDRSSTREARNDACWRDMKLTDSFDTANRERLRPIYHHTPLYGWMNDPNGMFYKDGVWHLYFQRNPYGSKWQNMTWGHSTSTDLVNWTPQPDAIEPNALGTIFSGSSVVDTRNSAGFGKDAIIALYTSADATQQQSLAWSTDGGYTFNYYDGNPIITLDSEARDPNMFWHEPTQRWVLLLAHALDHEMLILTSPDLKNWTVESSFGKGLGAQDGVWECPDLFELSVDGTDLRKWVLLCNINPGGPFGGSGTQYFIGDFDGKTFTPDRNADGGVDTKWLDFGKDNYANVSWSDTPADRRTIIGWMSNWQYAAEVPTTQFRSANTLPREMAVFTAPDGKLYVTSTPSPEIDAIRSAVVTNVKSRNVGTSPATFALPKSNDGVCEINLDIDPRKAKDVTLTLSNSKGEKVVMVYNQEAATLSFDRSQSGTTDFSQDFPVTTVAPTFGSSSQLSLRIYVDRSSIEIFGNDGRFAMTNLVFPGEPYTTLSVAASNGSAKISNLKVYSIKVNK